MDVVDGEIPIEVNRGEMGMTKKRKVYVINQPKLIDTNKEYNKLRRKAIGIYSLGGGINGAITGGLIGTGVGALAGKPGLRSKGALKGLGIGAGVGAGTGALISGGAASAVLPKKPKNYVAYRLVH